MSAQPSPIGAGRAVLERARRAVALELGAADRPLSAANAQVASWLERPAACLVTIHHGLDVRAHARSTDADQPLGTQVGEVAVAAVTTADPPLRRDDLAHVTFEVAVLDDGADPHAPEPRATTFSEAGGTPG